MAELDMLKQDKNRKYNCLVQLAVYSQTVEVTLYLTPATSYRSNRSLHSNERSFNETTSSRAIAIMKKIPGIDWK
jgi:hypothetical protein